MMRKMNQLPPTNLHGNYDGSCIACLRGTDSALGFQGEAEWIIAAIMHITGDPMEQAAETFRQVSGSAPGEVPDGIQTHVLRLCTECAARTSLPVAPVALTTDAEVPTLTQST
jgi:hypothetical protein